MTNDRHHDERAQGEFFDALLNEQPPRLAPLLRACADGELSDEQCARLREYIQQRPDAASQVRFEEALRGCCSRVMKRPCCPDALRAKVAAIASAAAVPENASAHAEQPSDEAYAQRIEDAGAYTRDRSFWARSPLMSAAAALLIVVAGALIWQSVSLTGASMPAHPGLNFEQASYYERVSDFVVHEHNRCCDDRAARSKLIEHDINQAVAYFSEAFERPVTAPDMATASGDVRFYGGGDCSVPSTDRSGHLRFDVVSSQGEHLSLSLFISPDPQILPLEEGKTYVINARACSKAGAQLFAWVSDGIQYLLVSEASDEACARVRGVMKAPPEMSNL